ncbi:MAG TPA: DnaB-like helicase C-terminal domain-containing protein [Chloroflexota bacterium]|nr:DnaB-like helicase C-terminal domain-containing protein [Chloroflexota bacterium]
MSPETRASKNKRGSKSPEAASELVGVRSIRGALAELELQLAEPERRAFRVWQTGFEPLDEAIGGGIRDGALVLLAGVPSVGKTSCALQMARNIARVPNTTAVYLCFEHEANDLLVRLLAMEGRLANPAIRDPLEQSDVRRLLGIAIKEGKTDLDSLGQLDHRLASAMKRVDAYSDRLYLGDSSTNVTTIEAIDRLVDDVLQSTGNSVVLFVDYLQKLRRDASDDDDADDIVEHLKGLALDRRIGVVAISALDESGLRASRLQTFHLLGGPVLAYEADAIIMLEEKSERISRVGFEYSPQKLASLRDQVVFSVIKNRSGRDLFNLEFEKRFAWSCFNPIGSQVTDPLVDDKQYRE